MTGLWIILAFLTGCVLTWKTSGWMMKKALGRSMFVDIVKGLQTETLVKVRDQAADEIDRRKRLLAEKARAA